MTAALNLPLAHIGHWYFLLLFMAPGLLVVAGAIHTALRERRRAKERGDPDRKGR